jgi:hypothetical protein
MVTQVVDSNMTISVNSATAQFKYSLDTVQSLGFNLAKADTFMLNQYGNINYVNLANGCYWNGV